MYNKNNETERYEPVTKETATPVHVRYHSDGVATMNSNEYYSR